MTVRHATMTVGTDSQSVEVLSGPTGSRGAVRIAERDRQAESKGNSRNRKAESKGNRRNRKAEPKGGTERRAVGLAIPGLKVPPP